MFGSSIVSRVCTRRLLNSQRNISQQLSIHHNTNISSFLTDRNKIISSSRPWFNFILRSHLPKQIRNKVTSASDRKVINNVILYKYEKARFYKVMNGFGIITCAGLLVMVDNLYNLYGKQIFDATKTWSERLRNNYTSIIFMITGIVSGPIILSGIVIITMRTVKYLILHKGGLKVTMISYHPWKSEYRQTIPIDSIKCLGARNDTKHYVALKVRGKKWSYLMDKDGEFLNPQLFDVTAGRADNTW